MGRQKGDRGIQMGGRPVSIAKRRKKRGKRRRRGRRRGGKGKREAQSATSATDERRMELEGERHRRVLWKAGERRDRRQAMLTGLPPI